MIEIQFRCFEQRGTELSKPQKNGLPCTSVINFYLDLPSWWSIQNAGYKVDLYACGSDHNYSGYIADGEHNQYFKMEGSFIQISPYTGNPVLVLNKVKFSASSYKLGHASFYFLISAPSSWGCNLGGTPLFSSPLFKLRSKKRSNKETGKPKKRNRSLTTSIHGNRVQKPRRCSRETRKEKKIRVDVSENSDAKDSSFVPRSDCGIYVQMDPSPSENECVAHSPLPSEEVNSRSLGNGLDPYKPLANYYKEDVLENEGVNTHTSTNEDNYVVENENESDPKEYNPSVNGEEIPYVHALPQVPSSSSYFIPWSSSGDELRDHAFSFGSIGTNLDLFQE